MEFADNPDKVCGLRVEYKKAAHFGDVVIPMVYKSKEKTQVQLNDEKDGSFAVVELCC